MTLIEAIKSGRRFRRIDPDPTVVRYVWYKDVKDFNLTNNDILANDYELEPLPEKSVTLTKDKINRAFCKIWGAPTEHPEFGKTHNFQYQKFLEELGLGE